MDIDEKEIQNIITKIDEIINYSYSIQKTYADHLTLVHESYKKSAENLICYMALRNFDIRKMQEQLSAIGLSSIGRSEGHVMDNLLSVKNILNKLLNREEKNRIKVDSNLITYEQSKRILYRNVNALLGLTIPSGSVRIMVTLDRESGEDYKLIGKMLEEGMNCARINCAYNDPGIWKKMIGNIKKAQSETGKTCKILMDLAGPKLRTGKLKDGPEVLHIKPRKSPEGNIIRPARIFLAPEKTDLPFPADYFLQADPAWISKIKTGDDIFLLDARNKKRRIKVTEIHHTGFIAEAFKSIYLRKGTVLRHYEESEVTLFNLGNLTPIEIPIILMTGDYFVIHKSEEPGEPATFGDDNKLIKHAHISCTLPDVLKNVNIGERVLLNDGKIEGVIDNVSDEEIGIKITYAKKNGSKLRAGKSINFPESNLKLSGLTIKDKEDLLFIAENADIVNMSFVNNARDSEDLIQEIRRLNASHLGIMLKIETQQGFQNLPSILIAAMQTFPVGIMIARGDLAVEAGWIRLAEVQEEILWLCEAGHIPVVWATQVLDNLARKGSPSRAEITDAAMSQRADCVMLNKGPHIIEAIKVLKDIMGRMQNHQHKKMSMLRRLKIHF